MKNLTWQNPEQLFVAQVLINKVKSKCCGIKDNQNFGHAIVCIGVEESDEFEDTPTKLFCIDPGFLISNTSYWNCMIMLPKKYDDNTELTYVVGDDTRKIMLDDVIVFD